MTSLEPWAARDLASVRRAPAADAPPTCPRCQGPCRPGNLWEEVLLTAPRHGIIVRVVDDPDRFAAYGGMVAALDALGQLEK